jgi:hypothetical protein
MYSKLSLPFVLFSEPRRIGGRIRLPRRHFFRRHRPRIHIDRDRHRQIASLRLFLFSKNSKNRKKHVLFTAPFDARMFFLLFYSNSQLFHQRAARSAASRTCVSLCDLGPGPRPWAHGPTASL